MKLENDPWNLSDVGVSEMTELAQPTLGVTSFDWVHHFSAHWHNRLVHFPVVLVWVMAALSVSFWNGDRRYWSLFKVLWGVCVVMLWLAVFTGQRQWGVFLEGPMASFVLWHQRVGFACAIGVTLGYGLALLFPVWSKTGGRVLCVLLWFHVLLFMGAASVGGILSSS